MQGRCKRLLPVHSIPNNDDRATMERLAAIFVFLTLLTAGRPALAETPESTGTLFRIAILTPAIPEKLTIVTGDLIPLMDLGSAVFDNNRNARLTKLAKDQGYNVAEHFMEQARGAFADVGYDAVAMPIKRSRHSSSGAISREELPERIDGRTLLDVDFQHIGVTAPNMRLSAYEPSARIRYRLIAPTGSLFQSSRVIYYCRPGLNCMVAPAFAPMMAELDTSDCKFATYSALERDSARLWSCVDGMLRKLAEKIALDIKVKG